LGDPGTNVGNFGLCVCVFSFGEDDGEGVESVRDEGVDARYKKVVVSGEVPDDAKWLCVR
jgi:hypothetical protein